MKIRWGNGEEMDAKVYFDAWRRMEDMQPHDPREPMFVTRARESERVMRSLCEMNT